MTDRQRLLREEQEGWGVLFEQFDRVAPARFEEPTLTPDGWSPKDAMFHVAGWMADCAAQLERMRANSFEEPEETRETIERQNRAWFEESRDMAPEEVRSAFESSRRDMVAAFDALTDLSGPAVEWFEESGALHYAKHVDDLRGFLGDRDP
jgi:hypothetical protein